MASNDSSMCKAVSSQLSALSFIPSARRALPRRRLRFRVVGAGRSRAEAAYVSDGAVRGARSRAHHLGEQLNVVVCLARHLFAYRVQLFEESWLAVHDGKG